MDAVRGTTSPTLVVTSDRALRDRVRALGAQVASARWLRDLLDET
ncbi:NYN domain-containing protein [Parafrankia elaeagni]|nr:NYN domain-containing protein [Parafrankia elaeagni]